MNRHILLITFLLACLTAQAQSNFTVHRRDCSTQRFAHGIYSGNVHFWGSEAEGGDVKELTPLTTPVTQEDWQVTDFMKNDAGDYAFLFIWDGSAPTDLPQLFCIGTAPGVTTETADTVIAVNRSDLVKFGYDSNCAVAIGSERLITHAPSNFLWTTQNLSLGKIDATAILPLLHGQTYRYRIAAQIPTLRSDGGHDTLTVYGPEHSFRIPDLMVESADVPASLAADGLVYPSPTAWEAFRREFFKTDSLVPCAEALGKMWVQWCQTPEGQAQDTTAATIHRFDDGTIRFMPTVPAAFYEWACSREIVLNTVEDTRPVFISVQNQEQPQSQLSIVTIEQEDWPLEQTTYVKATPIDYPGTPNKDAIIDFDTRGVMPGVTYRLTVTFAPEGELPETEENAQHFKPTRLRMGFYQEGKAGNPTWLKNNVQEELSETRYFRQQGTEPTVITIEAPEDLLPNPILRVISAVRAPDLNRGIEINTLRVAEVKLTPMGREEDESVESRD